MATTRGKPAATTALIPFECPQCDRHYRVELDFVKMRRLNRVAVCRGCDGRYTLSIRLERSAEPFDPDPYAAERLLADDDRRRSANVRRLRDERPDRSSEPVLGETKVGNVYIMNTDPPEDSVVPSPSDPPSPSTRPKDSAAPGASPPPTDSEPAADSDPPKAREELPAREPDWPPGLEPTRARRERERRSRAETEPSRRSPVARQDSEPRKPPFAADDSDPPPDSDPGTEDEPEESPLSDRRPRRTSSRYERTLDGVKRPDSSPPSSGGVDVRVIVEVGLVGDKTKRKTTKNYRPEHLITLPGLGVPQGKQSDDRR